jgi:hypothetical protein
MWMNHQREYILSQIVLFSYKLYLERNTAVNCLSATLPGAEKEKM